MTASVAACKSTYMGGNGEGVGFSEVYWVAGKITLISFVRCYLLFSLLHPSHRFPIIPPSPHHSASHGLFICFFSSESLCKFK
ncbi:LOW QUALITY PROTEIN: hypothetical protein NC651_012183 [Populus alba x Populus x berolinensis]|nr:LOW QUALITY PROTEIN: hypothetical protein NC651_012163 [Populus alba x Populus x berolinensis]KAJ6917902.1 LOW QUALITY PROTEIN: hypothetical protein NC651_012183 [Populus alba x Populus x berolinensis]